MPKTSSSEDGPECPKCGFTFTPDEGYYYDVGSYRNDECQECGCKFNVEVTHVCIWNCSEIEPPAAVG